MFLFSPQATLLYSLLGSKSVSSVHSVPDWSYKFAPLLTVIPMICIPIFLFVSLKRVRETHQLINPFVHYPVCIHSSFHASQSIPSVTASAFHSLVLILTFYNTFSLPNRHLWKLIQDSLPSLFYAGYSAAL